jgi:signal transduction histidine kinase
VFCSKIHDGDEYCKHDWFQFDKDSKQYFHIHNFSYRWNKGKNVYIETIKNITPTRNVEDFSDRTVEIPQSDKYPCSQPNATMLSPEEDSIINWLNHDLRNSLNPIISLLPVLLKNETSKNHEKLVEVVEKNASHIKNLIDKSVQLATLRANILSPPFSKENLSMVINELLQNHWDIITEKQIHIQKQYQNDVIVRADPTYLPILLNHLLENAIQHTPSEGTIRIEIINRLDGVHLSISDTGSGMSTHEICLAFEPCYKADPSRHHLGNSGLGLSICKLIMQRYGGSIDICSEGIGKGTTIHVRFPQLAGFCEISD